MITEQQQAEPWRQASPGFDSTREAYESLPEPTDDDEREALATQYARANGDSQTRTDFLAGWDAHARRTMQGESSSAIATLEHVLGVLESPRPGNRIMPGSRVGPYDWVAAAEESRAIILAVLRADVREGENDD